MLGSVFVTGRAVRIYLPPTLYLFSHTEVIRLLWNDLTLWSWVNVIMTRIIPAVSHMPSPPNPKESKRQMLVNLIFTPFLPLFNVRPEKNQFQNIFNAAEGIKQQETLICSITY